MTAMPDLRAAPGAGSASSCTGQESLPSWPHKSPHLWASLGAPSPADAHDARACGAHHEVTAAGGSSIIEFAGAAPRRPKTCPNATRNALAFRSHSPANFEFPRPCRQPRRGAHHEHQRDHRRKRVGGLCGPPLKAPPLRLRQALAAHGRGHRRGPLRCPI